jgi:hypothetical protein
LADGFDDEPITLLAQDGLITRQLELTRNPHRLVGSIFEKPDSAPRVDGWIIFWHMPVAVEGAQLRRVLGITGAPLDIDGQAYLGSRRRNDPKGNT